MRALYIQMFSHALNLNYLMSYLSYGNIYYIISMIVVYLTIGGKKQKDDLASSSWRGRVANRHIEAGFSSKHVASPERSGQERAVGSSRTRLIHRFR